MTRVFVDCFTSTEQLVGRKRTYAAVKAVALAVGRFSVFEAVADAKSARLFTRLCADPEIEVFDLSFPWTGVRVRVPTEEVKRG